MVQNSKKKPATEVAGYFREVFYAAFFPAFSLAQRALCAAAILLKHLSHAIEEDFRSLEQYIRDIQSANR
jgi:hypothetical protein